MNANTTHRTGAPLMFLLATLTVLFSARPAAAVDPLWDHYKVYDVFAPSIVSGLPVVLEDQFINSTHVVGKLDFFANPVIKEHGPLVYGISDTTLHYAWWQISPHPWAAKVVAVNQFGAHTLDVFSPRYLWNPALKNRPGNPPLSNHYKCYDCVGPPVNQPIVMHDQFGSWSAFVTFPRFFCNPVKKTVPGRTYAIVDSLQHYVCYEFQPPDPTPRFAFITDQFIINRTVELNPSRMICVPTDKTGVTSTSTGTWGRIKVLYR